MTQIIKLKRTVNSAPPATLSFGELAYKDDTHQLFIGKNDNSVAIVNQDTELPIQSLTANGTANVQSRTHLGSAVTQVDLPVSAAVGSEVRIAPLTGTPYTVGRNGSKIMD